MESLLEIDLSGHTAVPADDVVPESSSEVDAERELVATSSSTSRFAASSTTASGALHAGLISSLTPAVAG